jgi:hypothetical protein
MNKHQMTAERLRCLVFYDPKTGLFRRLVRNTNATAGWPDKAGYMHLMVDAKTYSAHRLAWLYMTGEWPRNDIDHINGRRSDNRFCNLRDVPKNFNMQNERRARKNNPTGLMGAQFRKDRGKWFAALRVDGKFRRFGSFETPEEAHAAYVEAKRIHHPGFTL